MAGDELLNGAIATIYLNDSILTVGGVVVEDAAVDILLATLVRARDRAVTASHSLVGLR